MHISIPVYIPVDVDLSAEAVELLTSPVTADAATDGEAAAGDTGEDVLGLAPPPAAP